MKYTFIHIVQNVPFPVRQFIFQTLADTVISYMHRKYDLDFVESECLMVLKFTIFTYLLTEK